MNTKLTLKLDKNIIEKAKNYAEKHNVSLSQMVETYFIALVDEKSNNDIHLSPLVKELSGVLTHDVSSNNKDEYSDYLTTKYK